MSPTSLMFLLGAAQADGPAQAPPELTEDAWEEPTTNADADALVWDTGFVAQAWRPGVKLGVEIPLVYRTRTKDRLWGERVIDRELYLEPAFVGWHHWGNHTPLTLQAQLGWRRVGHRGWTREVVLSQGVTYAVNAGVTYGFQGDELRGSRLAGRTMSATSMGFGVGRDLNKARGVGLAWHVRPTMTIWAPYNTAIAPVFTVEFGVRRAWLPGVRL